MMSSNDSSLPSVKRAPRSVSSAIPPRTVIRPARIASTRLKPINGTASSTLYPGRGSTGGPRRASVSRCTAATTISCALRGSCRTTTDAYWIGSPNSVSGTTLAPLRTAMVTCAPAFASSLPISPPEFPTPTTSTRRPA